MSDEPSTEALIAAFEQGQEGHHLAGLLERFWLTRIKPALLATEANTREVERRREAEEEVGYWRREMLAKLLNLSAVYRAASDDDRRADLATNHIRPILVAFTDARLKLWHEVCASCGEFIRPGARYADYGEDFGHVCGSCAEPADHLLTAEMLDEAAIIAGVAALLNERFDV